MTDPQQQAQDNFLRQAQVLLGGRVTGFDIVQDAHGIGTTVITVEDSNERVAIIRCTPMLQETRQAGGIGLRPDISTNIQGLDTFNR